MKFTKNKYERMFASARRMLINMLSADHPRWTQERIHEEVARRLASGSR